MNKLFKSIIKGTLVVSMIASSVTYALAADSPAKIANAGTNTAVCAGSWADGNWADLEGTKITVSSETNGGGQKEGINFGWAWDKEYLNDAALNAGKYDGQYKLVDRMAFAPTGSLTGAGWWLRIGYHSGVDNLDSMTAKQTPVEITFQLPEAKSIGKVNLWPRAFLDSDDGKTAAKPERIFFPQAFKIQTSTDGKTWKDAYSKDYGSDLFVPPVGKFLAGRQVGKDNIARPTVQTFEFANVTAKYVKIVVTRKAVDPTPNKDGKYESAVCFSEIELYTGSGKVTPSSATSSKAGNSTGTKSTAGSTGANSQAVSGSSSTDSAISSDSTASDVSGSVSTDTSTTSDTSKPSKNDGTENNMGMIIGIIAGVVVLAGAGFALYWFKFKK